MRAVTHLTGTGWPKRRKRTYPYQAQSITDALAALPAEPEPYLAGPRFTAVRPDPARATRIIPELSLPVNASPEPAIGRPYVAGDPLESGTSIRPLVPPFIGDSLPPLPPEPEPVVVYGPERAPSLTPYAGPGWAGLQMRRWIANGEWEELPAIVERGLGQNAAEAAAGFRHSRTTIAEGMRQLCAGIGRPDLAAHVLQRTDELVWAARAAAAKAATQ